MIAMANDTAIIFGFLFALLGHMEYRIDKIYQIIKENKG